MGFSGNPVPTPGLTAGRVNGEKNTLSVAPARTAPLTDLRRWPGDGFSSKKQSRNSDLGVEQSRNSDFGESEVGIPTSVWCRLFRRRLRELRELRSDCSDSCRLRRAKARTQNIAPLSLEGVSQMDSILPERLLALVRPAFDLVLRRIRSLKRCVEACGCNRTSPRYAQSHLPRSCVSARRAPQPRNR